MALQRGEEHKMQLGMCPWGWLLGRKTSQDLADGGVGPNL